MEIKSKSPAVAKRKLKSDVEENGLVAEYLKKVTPGRIRLVKTIKMRNHMVMTSTTIQEGEMMLRMRMVWIILMTIYLASSSSQNLHIYLVSYFSPVY